MDNKWNLRHNLDDQNQRIIKKELEHNHNGRNQRIINETQGAVLMIEIKG